MRNSGSIEDRLAIRELLEAYASGVSEFDVELWGSLWADDAVWTLPDYTGIGQLTGKEAIVGTWQAVMQAVPGMVFLSSPGTIHVDGDTARVRSYTEEVMTYEGTMHHDFGRYDDELVKRDGQWLFHRRTFKHLYRK